MTDAHSSVIQIPENKDIREIRIRPSGWLLHLKGNDGDVEEFFDIGELAVAIVRHKKSEQLFVSGPGLPKPRHWEQIPAVVQAVAERTPPEVTAAKAPIEQLDTDNPVMVEEEVILSLITAMLTRPLVLLAGVSGSGKTQVAKRLGKAWAQNWINAAEKPQEIVNKLVNKRFITREQNGWCKMYDFRPTLQGTPADWEKRYGFTAVQSDWTDATHLWGYHVPLPESAAGFYGTQALRVFLQAAQTPDQPHFLLLDEMNLSRPEHYASDLLSAMETKADKEGCSERPIELHRAGGALPLRGEGSDGLQVPARIGWGHKLVVVGTVNVDETTFSFAPKVLDRAALLEFTDIHLDKVLPTILTPELKNIYEKSEVKEWFKQVQSICQPYGLHLGYRAAREILEVLHLRGYSSQSLDRQLRDKVLPRIRGPRAAIWGLLVSLLGLARGQNSEQGLSLDELVRSFQGTAKYPGSQEKILSMLRRAEAIGFTSYFG